jgi:hypothetical protein
MICPVRYPSTPPTLAPAAYTFLSNVVDVLIFLTFNDQTYDIRYDAMAIPMMMPLLIK